MAQDFLALNCNIPNSPVIEDLISQSASEMVQFEMQLLLETFTYSFYSWASITFYIYGSHILFIKYHSCFPFLGKAYWV